MRHWLFMGLHDRRRRRRAAVLAPALAAVAVLLWPMDTERYLGVRASGEMQDRTGRLLYAFLNADAQWCFARDLGEISPRLIAATIAVEDQRFRRHWGVDPLALVRAAWQNLRHRRIVSGASTLTMQVVKRGGKPTRSLAGKVWQAVEAVRLELRANKDAILAAYLNGAPYGLNLVGCEAAARRYFGKPASELTLAEAALLAGLPKSPAGYAPLQHPERALRRRNYVLRRMRDERMISQAEYARAVSEPLGVRWHGLPALAPHLAMQLRPEISAQGKVRTTLAADVQRAAERMVAESVAAARGEIGNAAAVVVDAESAEVIARVGAADFADTSQCGQMDFCRARRSPGSALKPFTYALAIERGYLYAGETLLDSALDYGLYDPENFDRRYRGLVSASEALRQSLNIPAVTILERVGYGEVHGMLRGIGLTTLGQPPERYGLGLTLGNCEVRLEELTGAYCMLAALGEWRPLRIRQAQPIAGRQVLSRGTCLKLYEMLAQPLPGETHGQEAVSLRPAPPVCWKTGTSTGRRDAWAFVFNRHYVVGVWMGNAGGRPSEKLVGADSALPLAARLFRALPPKTSPAWPDSCGEFYMARVCALSGLPASPFCPNTRSETFPRNQYLNRRCDMHHPAPKQDTAARYLERWPASARGWNLARIQNAVAPPNGPTRASAAAARALRILSPPEKAEFVLTGEPDGDRIRLRASLDDQMPLHWYADGMFLGTSTPEQPLLFPLSPGQHTIACMTPDGLTDRVVCNVAEPSPSPRYKE
ncbi:MAG: penicillin-binding protein 1C [Candidatus Sumerlaeia bacterium]|nr:penicillin-binding protein 1C [Candidatus Sumerlaeia bacterium]